MAGLDDEENQKKGFVGINYLLNGPGSSQVPPPLGWKLSKLMAGLPVRFSGIHFLHHHGLFAGAFLSWAVKYLLPKQMRVRIRVHCGEFEYYNAAFESSESFVSYLLFHI
jgi:hypothetical protein